MDNEELEKIGRYTRREMSPDELYVFKVTLCDNDIDRDYEYFTDEALEKLAELFVGKTGIYDHDPTGKNQWARIYDTQVLADENRLTQDGRPYRFLQAKAYMVRTAANADLIAEIEGGIKKEVSVGCRMEERVCNICGADKNKDGCTHRPGQVYDGKLCAAALRKPSDAYEFSFVAVPAQPAAGITKRFGAANQEGACEGQDILTKLFACGEGISAHEREQAKKEFARLKALSLLGEEAVLHKRREMVRTAAVCRFPLEPAQMQAIAARLEPEQLDCLTAAIKDFAQQRQPVRQLVPKEQEKNNDGLTAFRL